MDATKTIATLGAALGLTGVIAGAFGAHLLRDRLSAEGLGSFQTGVRYQLLHAVALLLPLTHDSRVAGWCMALGTVLFSGSIYLLVLLHWKWLGPVTPVGGVLLISGWAALLVHILRGPKRGEARGG